MKKRLLTEAAYVGAFAALAVFFFFKNIGFEHVLSMGDTIPWLNRALQDAARSGFSYLWENAYAMASRGVAIFIKPSSLLLLITPTQHFPQVSLMAHLFIGGYGMFLFLRQMRLALPAAVFGAIAFMFTNDTLTLILPGHLGKFETFAFFPLVLYFLHRGMDENRIRFFPFAGACLGIAFLGTEVQVGVYFAIVLCFYFLYLLYRKKGSLSIPEYVRTNGSSIVRDVLGFVSLGIVAIAFTLQAVSLFLDASGKSDESATKENPAEQWDWATMWSFPPEEIIDFAAPGMFGFYTGSQTHPYWGRMGYIEGKTSWNNFKHGTENAGLIAVVFALFAIIVFRKKEEWFWGAVALIVLLASFGRYFPPIFGAMYNLPYMSLFRNPNKFIHIFTLALAILSAFGFHYFVDILKKKEEDDMLSAFGEKELPRVRVFNALIYCIGAVGFLVAAASIMNQSGTASSLASRWGDAASTLIAKNIATYGARFFFMAVLVASLTSLFLTMRTSVKVWEKAAAPVAFIALAILMYLRDTNETIFLVIPVIASAAFAIIAFAPTLERYFYRALAVFCIIVLAVDLWYTGQFFVITQDYSDMHRKNRIIRTLEDRRIGGTVDRTRFLSRNGILNHFITHTFPYYGLPLFEAPAMRTMRSDHERFFQRFSIQDPLQFHPRFYQLMNIRYLISDFPVSSAFSPYLTNLDTLPIGNGQTVYLYDTAFARPRFEIAASVIIASNFDAALDILAQAQFDQTKTAVVHGNNTAPVRAVNFLPTTRVSLMNYDVRYNTITTRCAADGPALLVVKEMYHADWKAYVNGKRTPVLKANCLSMGVLIDRGEHTVTLKYEPQSLITLQLISVILWVLFIAGLIFHFITEYRTRKDT